MAKIRVIKGLVGKSTGLGEKNPYIVETQKAFVKGDTDKLLEIKHDVRKKFMDGVNGRVHSDHANVFEAHDALHFQTNMFKNKVDVLKRNKQFNKLQEYKYELDDELSGRLAAWEDAEPRNARKQRSAARSAARRALKRVDGISRKPVESVPEYKVDPEREKAIERLVKKKLRQNREARKFFGG